MQRNIISFFLLFTFISTTLIFGQNDTGIEIKTEKPGVKVYLDNNYSGETITKFGMNIVYINKWGYINLIS